MKTKTTPKPRQTPFIDIITELRRAHGIMIHQLAARVTELEADNRTLLEVLAVKVLGDEARDRAKSRGIPEDQVSDEENQLFSVGLRALVRHRDRLHEVIEQVKSRKG